MGCEEAATLPAASHRGGIVLVGAVGGPRKRNVREEWVARRCALTRELPNNAGREIRVARSRQSAASTARGFAARPRTYARRSRGLRSNPTVWAFSVATVMLRACDTLSGGLSCGLFSCGGNMFRLPARGHWITAVLNVQQGPRRKKIEIAAKGAICSVWLCGKSNERQRSELNECKEREAKTNFTFKTLIFSGFFSVYYECLDLGGKNKAWVPSWSLHWFWGLVLTDYWMFTLIEFWNCRMHLKCSRIFPGDFVLTFDILNIQTCAFKSLHWTLNCVYWGT